MNDFKNRFKVNLKLLMCNNSLNLRQNIFKVLRLLCFFKKIDQDNQTWIKLKDEIEKLHNIVYVKGY